jgi:hypothetical protein
MCEKELERIQFSQSCRQVQWTALPIVLAFYISTPLQKQPHQITGAGGYGELQWGMAIHVACLDIGTCLKQHLRDLPVPLTGSVVQGSLPLILALRHVSFVLQ